MLIGKNGKKFSKVCVVYKGRLATGRFAVSSADAAESILENEEEEAEPIASSSASLLSNSSPNVGQKRKGASHFCSPRPSKKSTGDGLIALAKFKEFKLQEKIAAAKTEAEYVNRARDMFLVEFSEAYEEREQVNMLLGLRASANASFFLNLPTSTLKAAFLRTLSEE